jgi:hypothetical protein
MTKRILLIFCLLAAMILPAAAATKAHRHKHSVARSRKNKAKTKSIRRSKHRRTMSAASRKRAARRQKLARK